MNDSSKNMREGKNKELSPGKVKRKDRLKQSRKEERDLVEILAPLSLCSITESGSEATSCSPTSYRERQTRPFWRFHTHLPSRRVHGLTLARTGSQTFAPYWGLHMRKMRCSCSSKQPPAASIGSQAQTTTLACYPLVSSPYRVSASSAVLPLA